MSFLTGLPANARSTLHVEQSGSPDIEVNARFRSDALTAPIYWALRLSTESPVSVWSLELHHHKIFLEDPPAPVERFSISHGLNFLTLQRTWRRRPVDWRAGAGVIVAHPENTVRGLRLDESRGLFSRGYYVTGPAVLAGIARRVRVTAPIAVEVEARVSAARVRVPVHDGHARFVHLGVHLMVGLFGLLP